MAPAVLRPTVMLLRWVSPKTVSRPGPSRETAWTEKRGRPSRGSTGAGAAAARACLRSWVGVLRVIELPFLRLCRVERRNRPFARMLRRRLGRGDGAGHKDWVKEW